jgi:succinoglycan biosynthesis protein ExoA
VDPRFAKPLIHIAHWAELKSKKRIRVLSKKSTHQVVIQLNPKVSVVVPTKNSERTIDACLTSLLKNQSIYEIIIVDDSNDGTREKVLKYPIRLIHAPGKNISEARNLGVTYATGDIVAFTDDDCVVPEGWVEEGCDHFSDASVGAVGGPNLTPKDSSSRERCAGMALSSWFGTGASVRRYSIVNDEARFREVDESKLITCNLFLRKTALKVVGLFDPGQFPCEENELLHRMKQSGFKLVYVPSMYVWHKRRPVFLPFVRQIYSYGKGRALMIRRSASSFKAIYMIPPIFVIGLVLGFILSFANSYVGLVYGSAVLMYVALDLIASVQMILTEKVKFAYFFPLMFTFWLAHTAYGTGFLRGLFKGTDSQCVAT